MKKRQIMANDLTNRNYLRQAPEIVKAKYSLTKSESDLVLALLTTITKDDEDFKDYIFTKEELEKKLGIELQSQQLKNTAISLMQKVLLIEKGKNKWEILAWFSYFGYDNGVVTCSFDKRLKPYLLNLQQYALGHFGAMMKFNSNYARRIYLLCKEWDKVGSFSITIDELNKIFELPKSYQNFANLKAKVLDPSVEEINKFGDIEISYAESRKIRKKVTEITFTIKRNITSFDGFREDIKELYPNEELILFQKRVIKCSDGKLAHSGKSLLYFADNGHFLDSKTAQKAWEEIYKNRKDLLFYKEPLSIYR
jgi:plasmid replication initiation protein